MKKHAWKPVDLGHGLRLYQVDTRFPNYPQHNDVSIVAASSPSAAVRKIERLYSNSIFIEPPYFVGKALRVYQPVTED